MTLNSEDKFKSACEGVCERIRKVLLNLPADVKKQAQEIRLRIGRPVTVCCPNGIFFLKRDGGLSCVSGAECLTAGKSDLEESFRILCSYSIYSHENEIRNGYVTIRGGHRAGICGTAVYQDGIMIGLKDISSINVRIARELQGAADCLMNRLREDIYGGLLLAGPPSSGKTTILRDIARQLACGTIGNVKKVAVVDERGEIAGTFLGVPQNDVGVCTDVLDGYPKAGGIMQAVRSLSPQIVVCDEIGSEEETLAVEQSLNAGVCVIASIHAGSATELLKRKQALSLLGTGAFANVAVLKSSAAPGKIEGIYKTGDLLAKINRSAAVDLRGFSHGVCGIA